MAEEHTRCEHRFHHFEATSEEPQGDEGLAVKRLTAVASFHFVQQTLDGCRYRPDLVEPTQGRTGSQGSSWIITGLAAELSPE